MHGTSDQPIYLAGADSQLVGALIREYSDNLIRYAYCYLKDSYAAEDVASEAFATLIFKKKKFESRAAFKSYLYKVARSRCVDALRVKNRTRPLEDVENVLFSGDLETDVAKRDTYDRIYRCLQQLPEQYKEILYLRYFEEFTVDELCGVMKRNRKQVYNLLSRAKSALKHYLTEEVCHEDL